MRHARRPAMANISNTEHRLSATRHKINWGTVFKKKIVTMRMSTRTYVQIVSVRKLLIEIMVIGRF